MLLDLQVMDLIICSAYDNNKYTTKSFKVDMFSIASEPKHGREFLLPKMFSHETSLRKNWITGTSAGISLAFGSRQRKKTH